VKVFSECAIEGLPSLTRGGVRKSLRRSISSQSVERTGAKIGIASVDFGSEDFVDGAWKLHDAFRTGTVEPRFKAGISANSRAT
jgi:hypothetical protein